MPTVDDLIDTQRVESLPEADIERVLNDEATALAVVRDGKAILHAEGDTLDVSKVRRRTFDTLDLDAYELTFSVSFVVTPEETNDKTDTEHEATSETWGLDE